MYHILIGLDASDSTRSLLESMLQIKFSIYMYMYIYYIESLNSTMHAINNFQLLFD